MSSEGEIYTYGQQYASDISNACSTYYYYSIIALLFITAIRLNVYWYTSHKRTRDRIIL